MATTVLYLSPQFPRNFIQFVLRLKSFGVRVLGIGPDHFGALPHELRAALAEYYQLPEMTDVRKLRQAGDYLQGRWGPIDAVESQTEFWLPYEAELREHLRIDGKDRAETEILQRKSLMKLCFRQAQVPVANSALISTPEEALHFLRFIGKPLVAKPDRGVGAHETYLIASPDDVDRFFRRSPALPYFFEERIEGQIVTFDGLVDRRGEIVYWNSLEYSSGIMDVVNEDDDIFYYTVRTIDPELEELGRRSVEAFELRSRFFHLEFFRLESGEYVALELNARPPGGLTVDMWNFADDIDLYEEWARGIALDRFEARWERKFYVAYVGRKDRFRYVNSHEDIYRKCGAAIVLHERIDGLFRNALGDSGYLVRDANLERLLELVQIIRDRVQ